MPVGGIIETMATKKKRNKAYKGNAQVTRPVITRVSAVNRNRVHQWWLDNKRIARPVLIIGGIGVAIVIILIGLIDLIW